MKKGGTKSLAMFPCHAKTKGLPLVSRFSFSVRTNRYDRSPRKHLTNHGSCFSFVRNTGALLGSRVAQAGFTIVETMIVLAVTGGMLIIAVAFVSGRQNRTEFQTSINDLQQQLQQIVNETNSGHYNNNADFSCNGTGALVVLSNGSNGQGTNAGCIFMGNAIQFGTGAGNLASKLGIIPIVGRQYLVGTQAVQLVTDAKPRAVYPAGGETAPTDAVTTQTMQYGLTVATSTPSCPSGGLCYDAVAGGTKAAGTLGIITGDSTGKLASADAVSLKPGTPAFALYGVMNTTPNQGTPAVVQAIGNYTGMPQGLEPAKSASICIASGTSNQSGLIKITADLRITLQIFAGSSTCV